MQPRDPRFQEKVEQIFSRAAFIQALGISLARCAPGRCTSELLIRAEHGQQDGVVHAGVMATMADHTMGAAAGTLVLPEQTILSVGFQVNILRPGRGTVLRCEAEVVKPGRTVTFVEARVWAHDDGGKATLTLTASGTMAVVALEGLRAGQQASGTPEPSGV